MEALDTTSGSRIGVGWMLLAALALSYGLGAYALIEPDEGRNAVIAQEMAAGGDLLVPHVNGIPFLDKPFLFFAATAASMRLFGDSEWAVRLPSLLSTWATLALTVWFSARLFGRGTAWVAGTAFATALLTVSYTHILIFDSMLSCFVSLALMAFYMAVEEGSKLSRGVRPYGWTLLAWAAVAGAVFTKGPVGLFLPLLVALPFAFWRGRLASVLHPAGLLLHLALVGPWLTLVEYKAPGFLHYALVTETWQRLTTDTMHRTGPSWYYLPVLLGGTFPWIVLVLAAGWTRGRGAIQDRRAPSLIFLGLWVVLPLVFFSLSQSKRIGYLLPLVPAVALLAAWSWSAVSSRRRSARIAAAGWILSSGVLLGVGAGLAPERLLANVASLVPPTAGVLGGVMLVSGALGWFVAGHRLAPLALSLPLMLLSVICAPLMAEISESRSGKAMAAAAAPVLTPATAIVGIETYSASFAFYLGRPISVSTATGAPLRSNYALHLYPQVVGTGRSALQPVGAWRKSLAACSQPLLFLLKSRYRAERESLEAAGAPVLYADERWTLMGPCRSPRQALDQDAATAPSPLPDSTQ